MNNDYINVKDYVVKRIKSEVATKVIVKYHYLHRKVGIMYAFGLIRKKDNKLCGVVTYSCPASLPLCKGICGIDEKDNVLELSRLVINDNVGKNGESYLVSQSLKIMKKHNVERDIIVSFADSGVGHTGYIYQATNFMYCGLSAKHKDYRYKDGKNVHGRHFYDNSTAEELRNNDNLEYVHRSRKYRYIYFNCDKRRKKELMKKLKYEIKEYPKNCEINE